MIRGRSELQRPQFEGTGVRQLAIPGTKSTSSLAGSFSSVESMVPPYFGFSRRNWFHCYRLRRSSATYWIFGPALGRPCFLFPDRGQTLGQSLGWSATNVGCIDSGRGRPVPTGSANRSDGAPIHSHDLVEPTPIEMSVPLFLGETAVCRWYEHQVNARLLELQGTNSWGRNE